MRREMRPPTPPGLDFRAIRPQRGSQHGGFEELSVSLFREEFGEPFVIRIDGAGGDGGVEAFSELKNGRVVGLQAKYFGKLGPAQWQQIRSSIAQARKSYPTLKTYYVATPLALTKAGAKDWKKLQRQEQQKRPPLKLIWWGESEFLHRLTREGNAGLLSYWFGANQFTTDWIDRQNTQALADLDTRYTPERHVRISSEEVLGAFAREPEFVTRYYAQAGKVWKALQGGLSFYNAEESAPGLITPLQAARAARDAELPRLGNGKVLPKWAEVLDATQKLSAELGRLSDAIREAVEATSQLPATPPSPTGGYQATLRDRLGFLRHGISEAENALYEFHQFLSDHDCVDQRRLLVLGEAGSGKSHLLAGTLKSVRARGQCALMLLGEYFTTSEEPWTQLAKRLGWDAPVTDLIEALNYTGEVSRSPALLIIDALNESTDRTVWLNHLGSFAGRLAPWPWVRLVVSCRTDFLLLTLPTPVATQRDSDWSYTTHRGFGAATFEAITHYFSAYRVRARDFPPLLPEFENPLFLKTFCEAFEDQVVPPGPITLDRVMRIRVQRASVLIAKVIDCPPDTVWTALETLAEQIEQNGWRPVPQSPARLAIDALFPGKGQSRSLYQHLCSSKLIMEVGHFDHRTGNSDVRVRFAYERFSDYFIATRVLAEPGTAADLREAWKAKGYLATWNTASGYLTHRGLLSALAILLPGKYGFEFAELITHPSIRPHALKDFISSLQWRDRASFNAKSRRCFDQACAIVSGNELLRTLTRLACVPDHPWNADWLHRWLIAWKLPQRESVWTIPISQMISEEGESSVPLGMINWLFSVPLELVSDPQAALAGTLLGWFFSSNDRGFRRRATLAAIRILQGRPVIAANLVERFSEVNDPYVVERIFAVAAGVAVREQNPRQLAPLAEVAWKRVFEPQWNPPHVLVRDFAFTILETARNRNCLPAGVTLKDYQPPYRSRWPKIWSNRKARAWGKQAGWETIVSSIEPEFGNGVGGYGDFGRYTMEAHMHRWLNVRRNRPRPEKGKGLPFAGLVARAWVLQRVAQLGWTPDRFGEYEKNLRSGRMRSDAEDTKQERISKKYQWIALNELEGFASDHYHFGSHWGEDNPVFEGAWQLFSKNFDVAQPLRDPAKQVDLPYEASGGAPFWSQPYPDPFHGVDDHTDPSAWVREFPADPLPLLSLISVPGLDGPAWLLNADFAWDQPEWYPPRTKTMGEARQWMHLRSWIIPKADLDSKLRFLRRTHFWGSGTALPKFDREGLGEYPWSPRFQSLREYCAQPDRWGADFPPGFIHSTCTYSGGSSSASVPSPQLADLLGLKWNGEDFDFVDSTGTLIAFAPRPPLRSWTLPCIVEKGRLLETLTRHGLTIVWAALGERTWFTGDAGHSRADSRGEISGVYHLDKKGSIVGGITIRNAEPMHDVAPKEAIPAVERFAATLAISNAPRRNGKSRRRR